MITLIQCSFKSKRDNNQLFTIQIVVSLKDITSFRICPDTLPNQDLSLRSIVLPNCSTPAKGNTLTLPKMMPSWRLWRRADTRWVHWLNATTLTASMCPIVGMTSLFRRPMNCWQKTMSSFSRVHSGTKTFSSVPI